MRGVCPECFKYEGSYLLRSKTLGSFIYGDYPRGMDPFFIVIIQLKVRILHFRSARKPCARKITGKGRSSLYQSADNNLLIFFEIFLQVGLVKPFAFEGTRVITEDKLKNFHPSSPGSYYL